MCQNAIGAVAGDFNLLVHLALSERHDHENEDREDKSDGNIQPTPPFWEGRRVFRQAGDQREHRRTEALIG